MIQCSTVKTEETDFEHRQKKGKYSWFEDACVWHQHNKMIHSSAKLNMPLSGRSQASIEKRLCTLRNIEDIVMQKEADLSDNENIRLWNAFMSYKLREKMSQTQFVPQVDAEAVAALSAKLRLASGFLSARLQLIRTTKHYLYFSGIHLNEDNTLNNYSVTQNWRTIPDAYRRSGNFSLAELQALYRFKYSTDLSYTISDLANELNKTVESVRQGLINLSQQQLEANRIIAEGISLMWGTDSDLWHAYTTKHSHGSTHPANISLSTAISGIVAGERNAGPLHTHFRLNLIRNLKKFLHVAGIHDDQLSTSEPTWMPAAAVVPLSTNGSAGLTGSEVSKSCENSHAAVAALINDIADILAQQDLIEQSVDHILGDIIATVETNDTIIKQVVSTVTDLVDTVEIMNVMCVQGAVSETGVNTSSMSSSTDTLHARIDADSAAQLEPFFTEASVQHATGTNEVFNSGENIHAVVVALINDIEDVLVQQDLMERSIDQILYDIISIVETNDFVDKEVISAITSMVDTVEITNMTYVLSEISPHTDTDTVLLDALESTVTALEEEVNMNALVGDSSSDAFSGNSSVVYTSLHVSHSSEMTAVDTTNTQCVVPTSPVHTTEIGPFPGAVCSSEQPPIEHASEYQDTAPSMIAGKENNATHTHLVPAAVSTDTSTTLTTCSTHLLPSAVLTNNNNKSTADNIALFGTIAISKSSLRSSNSKNTTNSQLVPKRAVQTPVATSVIAGAGRPYHPHEDRIIWQTWLTAEPLDSNSVSAHATQSLLANQLKRSAKGIGLRIKQLITLREEANQAVLDGLTLLPNGAAMRMWAAYCALSPPMQSSNSVYIHPHTANQVASAHCIEDTELYSVLQAVRTIKWFLDVSGVHETVGTDEGRTGGLPTAPNPVSPVTPSLSGTIIDFSEPGASSAVVVTEQEVSIQNSSSHLAPSTLPPLPQAIDLPVVLNLQHDGNIWRAYLKSQQASSRKSLSLRLQKLADKLGYTFAQMKDRLSELINLHLGLAVQSHSNGRPFTAAEDALIVQELGGEVTNNHSSAHSSRNISSGNFSSGQLARVAARLHCSMGAVAARSKQLKTLQLLSEVFQRLHTQKQKQMQIQKPTTLLPAAPTSLLATSPPLPTSPSLQVQSAPARRPGLLTPSTNLTEQTTMNKIDAHSLGKRLRDPTELNPTNKIPKILEKTAPSSEADECLSAHFSTEGEENDG